MSETNSGFDYNTSIKDPKTGKEISRKDYKLEIKKNEQGEVEHKIESPLGSGNFFHPNGEKVIIEGDSQKKVPVNSQGQTEEEFNSAQKGEQKSSGKEKAAKDDSKDK